jgi:hypothetical protein
MTQTAGAFGHVAGALGVHLTRSVLLHEINFLCLTIDDRVSRIRKTRVFSIGSSVLRALALSYSLPVTQALLENLTELLSHWPGKTTVFAGNAFIIRERATAQV